VDQEWPFEGTNVFMLHAARPARVGDGAKALEGHA
jgi:hypothetical protein